MVKRFVPLASIGLHQRPSQLYPPDSRAGMATGGLIRPNQGEWLIIPVATLGNGIDSSRWPIVCGALIRARCRQSILAFSDTTGLNGSGAFPSSQDGQSGAFQESASVSKHVVQTISTFYSIEGVEQTF